MHAHMDPFYNECRAYGRLLQKNMNGKVAARCYGYLTLPVAREKELAQRFAVDEDEWQRPERDNALPAHKRAPLRAIVKQLIREDKPLTRTLVVKMLRDLRKMRSVGIYPMDIRKRNYKGGLLVDMSIAMVKPHYLFDIKPRWRVEMMQKQDLHMFQSMMDEAGGSTWPRAVPNRDYCAKLRSSKQQQS